MLKKLHCSFCGKSGDEIVKLAAGPGAIHICNGCVAVCQVIMHGEAAGVSRTFDPRTWPKERLIARLAPVNATAEANRQHLRQIVNTLRRHPVSWAVIGDALGVSRQIAWERFTDLD
jgi:hypothetical protein